MQVTQPSSTSVIHCLGACQWCLVNCVMQVSSSPKTALINDIGNVR